MEPMKDIDTKYVLVCGPTGTGKTTFINSLAKKYDNVSLNDVKDGIKSSTNKVSEYHIKGLGMTFIDTVSINTTFRDEDSNIWATSLLKYLMVESKHTIKKLSSIMYFHYITNPKIGTMFANITNLSKILGGDLNQFNVVVVLCYAGVLPNDSLKEKLEHFKTHLRSLDGLLSQHAIIIFRNYL